MKKTLFILSMVLAFVSCSSDDDNGGNKQLDFFYGRAYGHLYYPGKETAFNFESVFSTNGIYNIKVGVYYNMVNLEEEKTKYIIYAKGKYTYQQEGDYFIVTLSEDANLNYGVLYMDDSSIVEVKDTKELSKLFPTQYKLTKDGYTKTIVNIDNGTGITVK